MKSNRLKMLTRIGVSLLVVGLLAGAVACASGGTGGGASSDVSVTFMGTEMTMDKNACASFTAAMEEAGYAVSYDNAGAAVITDPSRMSAYVGREQKVDATVWQLSAEARACFIQSFNWARLMLDRHIAQARPGERLAIIADIDDTLVDGVMYTADVLQDGVWADPNFGLSLDSDKCLPLPGAVEFCKYAAQKGVQMFYVTNRSPLHRERTLVQLKKWGFPNADAAHLTIREEGASSSKESRRNAVEKDYKVVMYLGDNLGDFADSFARELGVNGRRDAVDAVAADWGTKFIMLPNAVYGDFEGAVYFNKRGLSQAEITQAKRDLFDEYKYTD